MNLFRLLLVVFCCFTISGLSAQKNTIKKANKLYKLNQYKEAIDLYEDALQKDENLPASTKLAYCYKMTNQTEKAENWYAKVVEHEKAKSITYYYYGEALMGNGKYDLAKAWFMKYNELVPDDKNAARMIYACEKVKSLVPYFPHVQLQMFEFNSDADESSPIAHNNGMVFTSDRANGINPLKQKSGWTGRDYQRIYFSEEKPDGSYSQPKNFSKKLNEINKHCGPVTMTQDKKTIVFTRTGQDASRKNSYNIQLYSAESDGGTKWKKVERLSFCNKEHNYMHPAISPDGQKLFFVSDKPGGVGGTDIYVSKKKGSKWGKPENLGLIINTPSNEAFPFFHESGKLFFSSKGHLSYGGFDVLFSHLKEDNTWQKPVNVGQPINSSYDDISFYINEMMDKGFFASSRANGNDDIYMFNILEGANTALDTLDFETIANEGPEIQGLGRTEIKSKDTETNSVASNTRVKASDSTAKKESVSEENNLDQITINSLEQIEVKDESENTKTILNNTPSKTSVQTKGQQFEKVEKEEVAIQAKTYSETVPDRKEKISTPPKTEIKKEAPPKQSNPEPVNLMIRSKEKKAKKELSKIDPTEEPIISTEPTKPKKETILKEPVSPDADRLIDETKNEVSPPVLIGDEQSLIVETPMPLANLAEKLKKGETVTKSGFIVEGINYPRESYLLSSESTRALTAVIDLMQLNPDLKIEIGSHTSSLGNDIKNHNTSRKRALSIKAFLVYKGISNERLEAKGYGETSLINQCSNGVKCSNEEHRLNERIEVRVIE